MPIIASRRYAAGKRSENMLPVDGRERGLLPERTFDWIGLAEPSAEEMELVRSQFGLVSDYEAGVALEVVDRENDYLAAERLRRTANDYFREQRGVFVKRRGSEPNPWRNRPAQVITLGAEHVVSTPWGRPVE